MNCGSLSDAMVCRAPACSGRGSTAPTRQTVTLICSLNLDNPQPAYDCRFENRCGEIARGAGVCLNPERIAAQIPSRGAATGAAPMKHPERVFSPYQTSQPFNRICRFRTRLSET